MSFSVQIRGEGNQTPRPSSFLVSYSFPQTRREWLQERLQSGITYTGVFAELRKPFWENAGGGGSNRTELSLQRILSRLIIAKKPLFYWLYFNQM